MDLAISLGMVWSPLLVYCMGYGSQSVDFKNCNFVVRGRKPRLIRTKLYLLCRISRLGCGSASPGPWLGAKVGWQAASFLSAPSLPGHVIEKSQANGEQQAKAEPRQSLPHPHLSTTTAPHPPLPFTDAQYRTLGSTSVSETRSRSRNGCMCNLVYGVVVHRSSLQSLCSPKALQLQLPCGCGWSSWYSNEVALAKSRTAVQMVADTALCIYTRGHIFQQSCWHVRMYISGIVRWRGEVVTASI